MSRYQVIFNNQNLTVAAVEDLSEALYIMQNSTGLPPYKVKFFNQIFYPLCKEKLEEKLKEYHLQEKAVIEVGATMRRTNLDNNEIGLLLQLFLLLG